jgi:hypothetical protein
MSANYGSNDRGEYNPMTQSTMGSTNSPYYTNTDDPSQQQNVATAEVQHPITLRVMRLRRPDFTVKFPIVTELSDFVENSSNNISVDNGNNALNKLVHKDLMPGLDSFGFIDEWALPNSFGKIYVGETFTSFISLHNHSYNPVHNVIVKVELLADNQKYMLLDLSNSPIETFAAKTNKSFIVEQRLIQEQKHILICTVQYKSQTHHHSTNFVTSQDRIFRKMFPFFVHRPLEMNAVKVYNLQEHVFVLLELQNKTHGPLFVDMVRIDPNFMYEVVSHSTHNKAGQPYEHAMLSGEKRRFLFELIPKIILNSVDARRITVSGSSQSPLSTLGKIELQWRGTFGESGTLITNPIPYKSIIKQEVELTLKKNNQRQLVQAEKPFKITCELHNRSSQQLQMVIKFDLLKMFPICVDGKSVQEVGKIEPHGVKQVDISLFALQNGVHNIGPGISLVDELTGTIYPTTLCQIYVHPPHDKLTPHQIGDHEAL